MTCPDMVTDNQKLCLSVTVSICNVFMENKKVSIAIDTSKFVNYVPRSILGNVIYHNEITYKMIKTSISTYTLEYENLFGTVLLACISYIHTSYMPYA